jgi:hypothetical protein
MTPGQRSSRKWSFIGTGAVAVAACAVCCIGPVLAVLGGVGAAAAIGAVWIPSLAVVAAAAVVGLVWLLRRRRAAACRTEQGVVDLGMPTQVPSESEARPVRH